MTQNITIGNRIPNRYFITKGIGESDLAIHSGSYHMALKDAGIERANIMTYSSILPATALEIKKPIKYTHGEVMESIMAVAHGNKGEFISSGIIYGILYHKETNEIEGGLVCENTSTISEVDLEEMLKNNLNELYINGFDNKFELRDIKLIKNSMTINKKYGTCICAICFVDYLVPILN